jgi:hypothetical protein
VALVLQQRWRCGAVLPRRYGAAEIFIFIFIFFNDSWQVQESSTSLHVLARNIEQERTKEL